MGSLALALGLVDQVLPRTQVIAKFQELFGADEAGYLSIPHKVYLSHLHLPMLEGDEGSDNHIGLIVASGTIVDGEHMEGGIGGDSLARLLQQARLDDSLRALVIRIDSPGGSASCAQCPPNATCLPCPQSDSTCTPLSCNAGYGLSPNKTMCLACSAGEYSPGGTSAWGFRAACHSFTTISTVRH